MTYPPQCSRATDCARLSTARRPPGTAGRTCRSTGAARTRETRRRGTRPRTARSTPSRRRRTSSRTGTRASRPRPPPPWNRPSSRRRTARDATSSCRPTDRLLLAVVRRRPAVQPSSNRPSRCDDDGGLRSIRTDTSERRRAVLRCSSQARWTRRRSTQIRDDDR